ncbi:hypothetical protein EKL32_28525 [Flavobacterium sp. GSN2]|nr:hypothetical protein EKL32_28525 [Flavobacterium sp. GSN2]
MEKLKFEIKKNFIGKYQKLIIDTEYLKFENRKISKDEIAEYKYGVNWINYILTFGREYVIQIRTKQNEILKIKIVSYFGYKVEEYHKIYAQIVDSLWDYHFNKIIKNHLDQFEQGIEFNVGEVLFTTKGVKILVDNGLKRIPQEIEWEKIRTQNYRTYFAIYSIDNPRNINRGFSYKEDWNTSVLYSVIRKILTDKEIENHQ